MKNRLAQLSKDYYRIEKAIYFLEENFREQPNLRKIAQEAGMSEYHFQRLFQRWAGISPKRFLQFLTKEYTKQLLRKSNVLDTSYEAGLSGPSRLHDLFIKYEAMSPGEYKQKGRGLKIDYGFHPSPFGECLIAVTGRGICGLYFLNTSKRKKVLKDFLRNWENAKFNHNQNSTKSYIRRIFGGKKLIAKKDPIKILCRGTDFQMKVWEALLKILPGQPVTYTAVARSIHSPKAVRAVGNAIGKNLIAYLIPCHRVIRSVGYLGGYRWGISRKRMMLAMESFRHEMG